MAAHADAQGVTNRSGLGLDGKSIEVKAALIIAILGRPSKDELGFDVRPLPPRAVAELSVSRRLPGIGIEQIAWLSSQDMPALSGDLIVANPAPAEPGALGQSVRRQWQIRTCRDGRGRHGSLETLLGKLLGSSKDETGPLVPLEATMRTGRALAVNRTVLFARAE